jgi:hypothetical protein
LVNSLVSIFSPLKTAKHMKRVIRPFAIACAAALSLTACKKDAKEATQNVVSTDALAAIQRMGFSTEGVQKTSSGYLVEGDINLSNADLASQPTSPYLLIAKEEQYHTFNLLSASKYPTVKIGISISDNTYSPAFTAALDEAISRYKALGLTFTMSRVTSGANITIVAFYEKSNTLGSSGFPSSAGAPYNQVKMNTYWYSKGTDATNVNYIATIMAHELGHCIGFRHTDYMSRRYSCGSGGNEGQTNNGVGAVLIPGTPSGPDAGSWMLACIGSNVNRPFNTNDIKALQYLW